MTGDKELLIKIRADIRQSLREMQRMTKEIRNTGKASSDASQQVASMGKAMTLLKRGAASYLSLRVAVSLVRQADAYNVLQVRIKTATKATGDYARVSRQLFSISQNNGVALETTVSLFQSIARSAPELNATNDEVLTLVNTVQQLGVISGASKTALSAGLLQFSQGLSAGVFRAEEFNSILENLPEVAVRIAKGMGKTVGELRKGVLNGTVLSREVFNALLKQAPEIAKEFGLIPDSVTRSTETLGNAFQKFLGQLDQSIGLTRTLASIFQSLSDELAGTGRTTAEIRKDIEALRARGPRRGLGGKAAFEAGLKRLEAELNAALEQAGGASGIRLKLQEMDDTIAQLEARLETSARGRNRRAEVVIRSRLNELKQQRQTLLDALTKAEFGSGKDQKKPPAKTISQKEQARVDANKKLVSQLQFQADTFGKTSEQIALYRLQLNGATPAQLRAAQAAVDSTNAMRAQVNELKAEIAAEQAVTKAEDDRNKQLKEEGQQVIQDTLTNQERLNQKITRYQELLDAGAISQDVFNKAVAKAKDDFNRLEREGDKTFSNLEAATRGWGDAFTNTLADMVLQGKGNFKDLADSIIRDLVRIQIQQRITQPLLQQGTAGLAKLFFASGGPVVGPGTSTSDSIPAQLSNGEYVIQAAAVRTYTPQFLEAINQMRLPRYANVPPIQVSRPGTHFASGGLVDGARSANDVKVEIVNNGQPARVADTQVSIDPKDFVIRVILEDQNNNGPAVSNLQQTFGLRRTPR